MEGSRLRASYDVHSTNQNISKEEKVLCVLSTKLRQFWGISFISRPLHLEAGTASNALTHPMSELPNIISVVRAGECLVTLSARVCTTLLDPGRAGRAWSQTAPSNRDNNSLSLARPHLEARRHYASWNTPGMSGVVVGDVVGIKWNTLKTNSAYLMFPVK